MSNCVLVNSHLYDELFKSLESRTAFDESFKVTSVTFFITNFNLLSSELDNFILKMLYWVILYWYYVETK